MTLITRLKQTWKSLPPKQESLFLDLEELMSSCGSFKRYRQALQTSESPCIPFPGVVLSDITHIHEEPTIRSDGEVNFFKVRQFCKVKNELYRLTQKRYNYEVVPVIQDFFDSALVLDEDELWFCSESCEPPSRPPGVIDNKQTSSKRDRVMWDVPMKERVDKRKKPKSNIIKKMMRNLSVQDLRKKFENTDEIVFQNPLLTLTKSAFEDTSKLDTKNELYESLPAFRRTVNERAVIVRDALQQAETISEAQQEGDQEAGVLGGLPAEQSKTDV